MKEFQNWWDETYAYDENDYTSLAKETWKAALEMVKSKSQAIWESYGNESPDYYRVSLDVFKELEE